MSLAIASDATLVAAFAPRRRAEVSVPTLRDVRRRAKIGLTADELPQLRLVGQSPCGDAVGDRLPQLVRAEDARVGDVLHLVPVGVDVGADDLQVGRPGGNRRDRFVAGVVEAVRDEVARRTLRVAASSLAIRSMSPARIGSSICAARLRQKTAWVRSVKAMYTRVSICVYWSPR